jgi:hypothetical protein
LLAQRPVERGSGRQQGEHLCGSARPPLANNAIDGAAAGDDQRRMAGRDRQIDGCGDVGQVQRSGEHGERGMHVGRRRAIEHGDGGADHSYPAMDGLR